jgi:hypothetical protein
MIHDLPREAETRGPTVGFPGFYPEMWITQ